jgi:hypothetical protein
MEEDSSIVKDTLGGLRSLFKERSVSPLMPAFIISWLMWNYRVAIIILSGEDLDTKFSMIDKIFSTLYIHILDGVLIPISFALAYIYLYPLVSLPIYSFSLNRQRDLREARQKADKEKLLSEQDKEKILAFAYDQKIKSQKQIDQQLQEIEQLNAKINQLEEAKLPPSPTPETREPGTQVESKNNIKSNDTFNRSSNGAQNIEENFSNPIQTPLQIKYDPKHSSRASKSRLLLTADQMMRHYIEAFLRNEEDLGDNNFLSSVMDGKIGITLLPKDERKSMTFNYSYSTDEGVKLMSEVARVKSQFLREVKKYL